MFKKGNKKDAKKQSGLVSLIVVSILAVVLGLIAVGFSQLMDREARRALDNELSAQAYYAAISGLNDARAYLAAGGTDFSGCTNWPALGNQYFVSDLSNGSNIAKYSCVSIDSSPNDLVYTIPEDQSVTFKISQQNINRLYFGWENANNHSTFVPLTPSGTTGSLPQEPGLPSNNAGLLETSVYAVPFGYTTQVPPGYPSDSNAILNTLARTYFMYPNSGGGAPGGIDYTQKNGSYVPGNCKSPNVDPVTGSNSDYRLCNTYIDNLNFNGVNHTLNNVYYVRLTARYAPLNVKVQATQLNGAGGQTPITGISDAQAVVDVTGQGTDVLQRIRARIDLTKAVQQPSYEIQSMAEVCKGFDVEMVAQGVYGDASNDPSISGYNYNNACAFPDGGGNVVGTGGDLSGPSVHHGLPPVTNPFPLVTAQLSAAPTTIYTGQSSTLTWISSGANSCSGVGGGPGLNTGGAANGSATITFPTSGTYTYHVHCTGFSGSDDSNPVTITVNTPPPPTAQIRINGGFSVTLWNGQSATLSWSSSNATTCAGNGFAAGGATSGSASTGALSPGVHNFSVTCSGPGGSVTSNTVVAVVNLQTCTATATVSGTRATASGSCNPAAYQTPQWTYVVTIRSACGNDTYSGPGNIFDSGIEAGVFTATFTIHGLYNGTSTSNTVSWSHGGGVC